MEADRDRPPITHNNILNDFDGYATPPPSRPPSSSFDQWHGNTTPPSSSSSSSVYGGVSPASGYIAHSVSRYDTLAGVAIKYGVEVADIKKMNGLVTDLQMFALKTLKIPLPGRHPPSQCLSNGSETPGHSNDHISSRRRHSDLFESLQSLRVNPTKVSPAMSSLHGYYGLKESENSIRNSSSIQMTNFRKGSSHYLEDGPFLKQSSAPNPPFSHHRKSRSLAVMPENDESSNGTTIGEFNDGSKKLVEKVIKKSKEGLSFRTPEKLLKDDSNNGGWFSAITGKGLALRSKAGSRTSLLTDAEASGSNADLISAGDFVVVDHTSAGVRKSSSTSSLQEQENNTSSMWPPPMWGLKPDFSTSAITKPIFDSLPKPITGRRNKAALD